MVYRAWVAEATRYQGKSKTEAGGSTGPLVKSIAALLRSTAARAMNGGTSDSDGEFSQAVISRLRSTPDARQRLRVIGSKGEIASMQWGKIMRKNDAGARLALLQLNVRQKPSEAIELHRRNQKHET